MDIKTRFVRQDNGVIVAKYATKDINWDFRETFRASFERVGGAAKYIKNQQNHLEMDTLLHWMRSNFKMDTYNPEMPFGYLEIGSYAGESLFYISQVLPRQSKIILVDYGDNAGARMVLEDVIAWSKQMFGHNIQLLTKNSNDISTRSLVLEMLGQERHFDLCLIDANHTYDFARCDYENFGPISDWTLFHDVSENHREASMEKHGVVQATVYHLWKTMKLCFPRRVLIGSDELYNPVYEEVWDQIEDTVSNNLKACGFGILNTNFIFHMYLANK